VKDDPPRGSPARPGPRPPTAPDPASSNMADPKLVIEAEPDDLVLESIAPPESPGSKPAGNPSLGSPVPRPGSSPSASRGPVLPVTQPQRVGPLPPPPSHASNPRPDRPPPPAPMRGTPASGTNPRVPVPGVVPTPGFSAGSSPQASSSPANASPRRSATSRGSGPDSSNLQTVPAPARDGSAKMPSPVVTGSATHERSSVTARDAVTAGGRGKPPSQSGLGAPPPPPPGSASNLKPPVAPTAATPGRVPGGTPATGTKLGRAPTQPVTSGSFQISSGVHSGQLAAYKSQSALMRMMAPFVEDPRPGWLLAGYFLVGVAVGIGAAFGLWGQTP
jgi:hypothetical protein